MPKNQENQELRYQRQQIDQIGGIAYIDNRWARPVYLGWSNTESGALPTIAEDLRVLSSQAMQDVRVAEAVTDIRETNRVNLPGQVEPVQFLRFMDIADFQNPTTQDVVNIEVTNHKGEIQQIQVKELDFLQYVLNSHIQCEIVNRNSITATRNTVPTVVMHAFFLPDALDEDTVYGVMFKSSMEIETNFYACRNAVMRVLEGLVELDATKPREQQKGYAEYARRQKIKYLEQREDEGGVAYELVKMFSDFVVELSPEELERFRDQFAGKSFWENGLALLGKIVFSEDESSVSAKRKKSAPNEPKINKWEALKNVVEDIYNLRFSSLLNKSQVNGKEKPFDMALNPPNPLLDKDKSNDSTIFSLLQHHLDACI